MQTAGQPHQMPTFELLVDRALNDDRIVVTNNSATGVPVGTVFTSLSSRRVRREGASFAEDLVTPLVEVSLELTEVESWRQSINEVPKGHTGAARLRGTGLELLKHLLKSRENFVYVFLGSGNAEA